MNSLTVRISVEVRLPCYGGSLLSKTTSIDNFYFASPRPPQNEAVSLFEASMNKILEWSSTHDLTI